MATTSKRKTTAIKDAMTKSQVYAELADNLDCSKKQVGEFFDELTLLIERHVKARGAGEFTLPGLCKIKVIKKAATKAKPGVNPFTGEAITIKAKPATKVIKVKPLKKLKDMPNV